MEKPESARVENPDVFVCYAHADSEFVYTEIEWLQSQGFGVWYDEGISAGTNWRATIGNALLQAKYVLFFISRKSLASDHCNREVNLALDEGKQIVPIYLEEVELTTDLKIGLNRVQAISIGPLSTAQYRNKLLASLGQSEISTERFDTRPKNRLSKPLMFGLAGLVAILLGIFGWWFKAERVDVSSPPMVTSLAVLPLNSIGLDTDSRWLTLGIPSELTSMLSKISTLDVASESSAFSLHASGESLTSIGKALEVDGLLVGSLQDIEGEFQVKIELIRASDSSVLWREVFTGPATEPRRLQTRLAGQIFKRFGAQLSSYNFNRPQTEEAYKAHLNRVTEELTGNVNEELKWAEMTTTLEPDYAMGYVNTVFPYLYQAISDPGGPWQDKARTALDTAAQLGIAKSSAYKAHEGLYQWIFNGNLDEAETLLREAFIDGDYYGVTFYLRLLAASGVHDPLLSLLEKLTVTEPYKPLHWDLLANQKAYQQDFHGSAAAHTKGLQLTPDNYFDFEVRAIANAMAGEFELAWQDLKMLRAIDEYPLFRLVSTEALVAHWEGDAKASVKAADGFAENGLHLYAGVHYLLAGNSKAQQELISAAKSPGWQKYWLDGYEWRVPFELRESKIWQSYRASLGYTDAWRLEICRRASTLPAESGLTCDPRKYGLN